LYKLRYYNFESILYSRLKEIGLTGLKFTWSKYRVKYDGNSKDENWPKYFEHKKNLECKKIIITLLSTIYDVTAGLRILRRR
jgi:hypothetical protein